ncbi:MAG: hypothetical protein QOH91_2787 [Mycobacterium sp.]|nr:hypothetical protein [Mycobacterium sp.]
MGEIICTTDPEDAARRDELLKINGHRIGVARTSWPLRTGTLRGDDTAAGTLALQARVAVDGVVGMLDDVAEPGRFMMIRADGDPLDVLDAALAAGWCSLGGVGHTSGPTVGSMSAASTVAGSRHSVPESC